MNKLVMDEVEGERVDRRAANEKIEGDSGRSDSMSSGSSYIAGVASDVSDVSEGGRESSRTEDKDDVKFMEDEDSDLETSEPPLIPFTRLRDSRLSFLIWWVDNSGTERDCSRNRWLASSSCQTMLGSVLAQGTGLIIMVRRVLVY